MGIETGMYAGLRAPDILGNVEQGFKMGDLIKERKLKEKSLADDQAYQGALKQHTVTNPDGTVSVDKAGFMKTLTDLGQGQKAQMWGQDQARTEMQQQAAQADLVNKQSHGDEFAKTLAQKERELSIREQEARNNRAAMYGAKEADRDMKRQEIQMKVAQGDYLPLDQKQMVGDLAKKNANKTAIANQIDAVMSNWDKLSDDQKYSQGGQLLKTLNSPEGADAVGAEEAKRLGGKLEFAYGNFTNSNPTQFGRDLKGFATQANDTAKSIRTAVGANQSQIDQYMGRRPQTQASNFQEYEGKRYEKVGDRWVPVGGGSTAVAKGTK